MIPKKLQWHWWRLLNKNNKQKKKPNFSASFLFLIGTHLFDIKKNSKQDFPHFSSLISLIRTLASSCEMAANLAICSVENEPSNKLLYFFLHKTQKEGFPIFSFVSCEKTKKKQSVNSKTFSKRKRLQFVASLSLYLHIIKKTKEKAR